MCNIYFVIWCKCNQADSNIDFVWCFEIIYINSELIEVRAGIWGLGLNSYLIKYLFTGLLKLIKTFTKYKNETEKNQAKKLAWGAIGDIDLKVLKLSKVCK